MMTTVSAFDQQPVIGQHVTGTSTGYRKNGTVAYAATWSGIYLGIRNDAFDGDAMHQFDGGEINGVPQARHSIPVAKFSNRRPVTN
jgi:hypothetical protein